MQEAKLNELAGAVIEGDQDLARELTEWLLEDGVDAHEILDRGLMPGMDVVGQRFRDNIIFVPEVLVAARAMKTSLALLEPLLAASGGQQYSGTVILGTVKGDIHDIGKNIVGMMLKGAGFRVVDLGIDTPAQQFVEAVRAEKADLVGMSALLTTTMGYMKTVIEKLREEGLAVKTLVGGAPLSESFAAEIGADGYAENAAAAVELARSLVPSRK